METPPLSSFGLLYLNELQNLTSTDRRSLNIFQTLAEENIGECMDIVVAIQTHLYQVNYFAGR